jgi:hypothetical protein
MESTKLWESAMINPIYVLHPDIMGSDYKKIKFMCNNGSCLPHAGEEWIKKAREKKLVGWTGPDIYNPSGEIHHKPMSLPECLVNCNELIRTNKGGGSPMNLIDIIKRSQKSLDDKYIVHRGVTQIPPWAIGIVVFVFAVVIISLVLYKK